MDGIMIYKIHYCSILKTKDQKYYQTNIVKYDYSVFYLNIF